MAKIPAGASDLFAALADSGHIKQRRNGSYKMVLKGVDEIDWFKDPLQGKWKPGKLVRKWNSYFANSEANAQVTLKADDQQEMIALEMFKPKLNNGKMILNVNSINESGADMLTELEGKQLDDISLLIDDASNRSACFPKCENANLRGANLAGAKLKNANLRGANLKNANLTGANLTGAKLKNANLRGANLTGAKLKIANLTRATLTDADLAGATLIGAQLVSAELNNSDLTLTNLKRANLTNADLAGSTLAFANLTRADLTYSILTNATLTEANLTNSIMHYTLLNRADLSGAIYNSKTIWPYLTWDNTICPDGTNSDSNFLCGF